MSNKEVKLCDPRILNKCEGCHFTAKQNEVKFVHFEYHGELKDIKVVFVGGFPGKIDAECKRPFHPNSLSGNVIRSIPVGLNLENYAFLNVISCWSNTRIPTKKESDYCSVHLNLFLNNINEKSTIFLLGKTAILAILSKITGYADECKTVASMAKLQPVLYQKRVFVPCYSPHYIATFGGVKSLKYQEYFERFKENI